MATKILMPKLSDTMAEGLILKWVKKEGEKVKQGEILVEIESDKANMELEAYDSGILRKIFVPEGSKASIGTPIAVIAEANEDITAVLRDVPLPDAEIAKKEAEKSAPPAEEDRTGSVVTASDKSGNRIKASPLAKRIAGEKKIDLGKIRGSGPNGRIVRRDIENIKGIAHGFTGTGSSAVSGGFRDVELSPIRKTIAKRMQESKQAVPHFYVTVEIDMEPAMTFRSQLNSTSDTKISFTDIIIKAAAAALMKHPDVNSAYNGNTARQYGAAHIAVAVALEDGLVTPVLRNCEQKSIAHISSELRELAERARNRRLKPDEYQGGTFTISNLGMFGVEEFAAIINPPEAAILAVGSVIEKPVVKKERITIGHTMKVTMSSDHRVIDGAGTARFLQDFKTLMENPVALLL